MGKRVVLKHFLKMNICLIFSLLGNFIYAQTIIDGVVMDAKKKSIPLISVLATKVNSDTVVAYTYTNNFGEFSLKIIQSGTYVLTLDGLAYARKMLEIEVGEEHQINLGDLVMQEEETQLKEVILLADLPITIKKDTIIFDTAAFSRGNEVVVEDILKNIPGLTVDANGRISIEGKEVEKVMVNSDDFFDKGYTILTKNMPSHAIDKVEVLQHYSKNRLLKGIEDSEKVALNLTLKESKKNIWFGDLSLSHDITGENRYDANANIMSFGDKNKYYFLTSLNNIGVDVSGDISYVVSPNRFAEPGTLGNDQRIVSLLGLTGYDLGLKQERVNFNNVELLSLNSIFNLTSNIKLKALALLKTDINDFFRNGFETYFLNDQTFTNTEDYTLRKNSLTGFGEIDLTYNISNTAMLEYTGKYNNNREDTRSNLQFNKESTTEFLKERNELIDQKVVYSNKVEENKTVVFTGRFIDEQLPQNYRVNQFFFKDLFPKAGKVNNILQVSENKMQFAGLEGHLLSKKDNGNLLELKGGYTSRKDNLISQLSLEKENSSIKPQDYSNNTMYNTIDLYGSLKYIHKLDEFSITGSLDAHQFYNTLAFEEIKTNRETPFFLNPGMRLEWDINNRNRLYTSYSYNATNAHILDLHNGFLLTSYRSFAKGTGELAQTEASNFDIGYRLGNWSDLFFATTSFSYTNSHNYFSSNVVLQPSYSLSTKIMIENREMFTGNIKVERYLQVLSTNVRLDLSFVKSEYDNIVNSKPRNVKFGNYNYGLEFRSGFSGIFNYNFGTKWKYNEIITGIETSYTDNVSFVNLNFMVNPKLNFEIESERYVFGNLAQDENEYYFLDFNAKYSLDKKKLSFSLQGRNLFDTNNFRSYSISDISVSSTDYRLLPRFVLLRATYRF